MAILTRMKKGKSARRGFTLIELAIVLAVASLLFAGLWRLMSSGNTQLRDQAAADQQQQLIRAVSGYLKTVDGQNWLAGIGANAKQSLALPATNPNITTCKNGYAANIKAFCDFLPSNFSAGTTNAYGQSYLISILKDNQIAGAAPKSYSFMIATSNGDVIPDTSGGRIASLIGNDGGFYYSADVCGAGKICGAFGAWIAAPGDYFAAPGNVTAGHVASRTYSGLNASQNAPWLARTTVSGSPMISVVSNSASLTVADFNALQADTYLGLVGSTGTIATIYGAANDLGLPALSYGGAIKYLRTLEVGRSATGEPAVRIVGDGCTMTTMNDPNCPYILEISGGVSIDDMLAANKLFAGQFIYRTDTSDRRLKTDIAPIENALEKLGQIKGYSFTMKASKEKKYGVIAQEVEKVFPEIVQKTDAKYIGVDYIGLIGPLVAAVNELKQQNEALRHEIAVMNKTVEELKKKEKVQ